MTFRKKSILLSLLIIMPVIFQAQTRVACVGNSITENMVLPNDDRYPSVLQRLLGDEYEVRNYGLSARTLLKKGDHPYWKENKYTEVLNWNPNIVIIKLGTNDGKANNWKYKSDFEKDYIEFVNSFKNLLSKPQIFVCYPIPVVEDNFLPLSDTLFTREMIPIIEKVAKKTKSKIIDLHTPLVGKPNFVYDKVHPNEKGTKAIARIIAKIICPWRSFPNPALHPLDIVFIGNSITAGAGIQTNPAKEAVYYLDSLGYDIKYKNCGISGYTSENFLPGSDAFKKIIDAADDFGQESVPLIFSIKLGTNDSAIKGPTGAPISPEKYEQNLQLILDSLHSCFAEARIILHYPLWYSPNTQNSSSYLQEGLDRLQSYEPVINKLAKKNKEFVRVGDKRGFDIFHRNYKKYYQAENGDLGAFYLHPNAYGAKVLGYLWAEKIAETLKK